MTNCHKTQHESHPTVHQRYEDGNHAYIFQSRHSQHWSVQYFKTFIRTQLWKKIYLRVRRLFVNNIMTTWQLRAFILPFYGVKSRILVACGWQLVMWHMNKRKFIYFMRKVSMMWPRVFIKALCSVLGKLNMAEQGHSWMLNLLHKRYVNVNVSLEEI